MNKHNLKCFGIGDGSAGGDRNHSAYMYQLGDAHLLVDCGEPVSRSFKASGLSHDTVDRIFLTHTHSDHFGGLFMLLQSFWLEKRRKDLVVHVPADAVAPLRQMVTTAYLFEELLSFELSFESLQSGQAVNGDSWKLTPYRTTHLEGFRKNFQGKYPGNYDAFCFLIEADGRRLGHSGDLGAVDDLGPLLANPLDVLVCELSHFRAERLFEFLQGRDIKHLVFTHLERRYWENFAETQQLAAKLLPGVEIIFPRDQDVIEF